VVLVSLRPGWLLLGGLLAPLLAASAASTGHALTAVHPAVAVPVGAAIAVHGVTLVLVMLAALLLAIRRPMLGMAGMARRRGIAVLLVLRMVLMLWCRRRRLRGGRHGERKRDRTDNNLHVKSPESFGIEKSSRSSGGSRRGIVGFGMKAVHRADRCERLSHCRHQGLIRHSAAERGNG
jgi:hypothetical protein